MQTMAEVKFMLGGKHWTNEREETTFITYALTEMKGQSAQLLKVICKHR